MNCTIPVGVLRERYSVGWFKGLTELLPHSSDHISVSDSALVFRELMVSDASEAYYCIVNVTRRNGTVTRQGSTLALNIMGK